MRIWGAAFTLLLAKHHTRSTSLRQSECISFDHQQEQPSRTYTVCPLHVTSFSAQSEPTNQTQQILQQPPPQQFVGPWAERAAQLQEYARRHGHCIVPKRYKENPSLGNWVNKQRQEYRKYLSGQTPCSLTPERIAILNRMGFCWDASQVPQSTSSMSVKETERWWSNFHTLQRYMEEHQLENIHSIPFKSRLDDWIRKVRSDNQNHQAQQKSQSTKSSNAAFPTLDDDQLQALFDLDPLWHLNPREALWERRYLELVAYQKEYGDCCVPISYKENKQLANWVSTQRKQYNLCVRGRKSSLTKQRYERLNAIGFVWNRWEHEFEMKHVS